MMDEMILALNVPTFVLHDLLRRMKNGKGKSCTAEAVL
jgi:hypothetical protein